MNFASLEYLNTISKSGTIIPSSKYLIHKCLEDLALDKAKVVLEFGMGDGCITKEILKRVGKETTLLSFEINKRFCTYCAEKFDDFPTLKILNESAFNFQKALLEHAIYKVDYVVSSLPMSLFDKKETLGLLERVKEHLTDQGRFIQYQYSRDNEKLIKNTFEKVTREFTFLNIPPAFVYKCA